MDNPKFLKIKKIETENEWVKTFFFEYELKSKPGQFVMLWLPDMDQKPFSISYDDGRTFGLTIFKRGPATEKLFAMKEGRRVGITGPLGTSFSVRPNTRYIMIAGGYGAAPLSYLAEKVAALGSSVDFCAGYRSADLILFENRLAKLPYTKIHIATDDGSRGKKGFVTDILPELLAKKDVNTLVVTCGPELMEKKVLDICAAAGVECEISIERYMKCGVGVCGQCAVDDLGLHMCVEGPVVSGALAMQIKEFGVYHRDKSGQIVYF